MLRRVLDEGPALKLALRGITSPDAFLSADRLMLVEALDATLSEVTEMRRKVALRCVTMLFYFI